MKKILILLMIVLISSMVLAVPSEVATQKTQKTQVQSQITGLENAMLRVRHNETAEHLNQVMNKIQEHRREMLNKMEGLVIEEDEDDDIIAVGKKEAKFLGMFKFKHSYKYQITEDGEVIRQKQWHDFLWKDLEVET